MRFWVVIDEALGWASPLWADGEKPQSVPPSLHRFVCPTLPPFPPSLPRLLSVDKIWTVTAHLPIQGMKPWAKKTLRPAGTSSSSLKALLKERNFSNRLLSRRENIYWSFWWMWKPLSAQWWLLALPWGKSALSLTMQLWTFCLPTPVNSSQQCCAQLTCASWQMGRTAAGCPKPAGKICPNGNVFPAKNRLGF